jgi:hypothetical protein
MNKEQKVQVSGIRLDEPIRTGNDAAMKTNASNKKIKL